MPNGKPNILVIWGDDIGITSLSCYGDGLMGSRTHTSRVGVPGSRTRRTADEVSTEPGNPRFGPAGKQVIEDPDPPMASFSIDDAVEKLNEPLAKD